MKQCPTCNFTCSDSDIVCKNCGHLFSAGDFPDPPSVGGDRQKYGQPIPPPYHKPEQPPEPQNSQNPGDPQNPNNYQSPQNSQDPNNYQSPNNYQNANYPPVQGVPKAQKTSGMAIAGMVLGIAGLIPCCYSIGILLGIPGLILSIIARVKLKASGEKGSGMALAGIICNVLAIIACIGIYVYIFVYYRTPTGESYWDVLNKIMQQSGVKS